MNTTVKDRLKKRLREVRMTQQELAEAVGLNDGQAVYMWGARGQVPLARLQKAAEALECDPDWLQTGEGVEEAQTHKTGINKHALSEILARVLIATKDVNWEPRQIAELVVDDYMIFERDGDLGSPESYERLVRYAALHR